MSQFKLTRLWVEVPFFSDALSSLPSTVEIEVGQIGQPGVPDEVLDVEAVLASSGIRYDASLFEKMPNLRIVQRTGIGVDNVDIEAATAHGVVVCNTPDGPTESTAEHTVAMLLNLAKRIKQGNDNLAAGSFGPRSGVLVGVEVQGRTLGLIGLGRIGRRVAHICSQGFGMRVIGSDPIVTPEQAKQLGIELMDLDEVIATADFLSLHAPAIPSTYQMMNRERLAAMKPGAFLLNMARGPLVDEAALLEAIDSGHLGGAGLDVFDPEPPAVSSRLRNHPLIVATPHAASVTVEGRRRIEGMAVERVMAFFRDHRPQDVVNPEVYESPALRQG